MRVLNKIGIIGLGKMGFRVSERMLDQGYTVVVNDLDSVMMRKIRQIGAIAVNSLPEMVKHLTPPKVLLVSIPSENIGSVIKQLAQILSKGDIVVDMSNSFYKDSQLYAEFLENRGIGFLDVGISGGIEGARNGACLMIGGRREVFEKIRGIFKALSNKGSYMYLGKSGSGHLVKGYHNIVEYGYLQSLAEGLACLYEISKRENMDLSLESICEIWNNGSIVESRITRDALTALKNNPALEGTSGSVFGQTQGEMERLCQIAKDYDVEMPSCQAALNARLISQKSPSFAGKIVNAIRNVFGGHKEW